MMSAFDNRRYQTLTRLEAILRQLVAHYGARMTLGELLAVTAAMVRLSKQERVTIAEIAEATGLSKQNLSRWARKRIGVSIMLRVNEEDRRERDLIVIDQNRGSENIEQLARIMKIEADGQPT